MRAGQGEKFEVPSHLNYKMDMVCNCFPPPPTLKSLQLSRFSWQISGPSLSVKNLPKDLLKMVNQIVCVGNHIHFEIF